MPQNATGLKERVAEMQVKSSALASAKTVTIVGGGATGIELACDICHFYPQTKVRSMLDRERHPVPFWLTLCACSMLKLSCAAKLALPRPLHALLAQS